MVRWFMPVIFLALAALLFVAGLFPDLLNWKNSALIIISSLSLLVLTLPMEWAMFTMILYIGIEGAAKLLTRYHPVIHVGVDILIFTLIMRTFTTMV